MEVASMKAAVIYDSVYGNTERIAQAIAGKTSRIVSSRLTMPNAAISVR